MRRAAEQLVGLPEETETEKLALKRPFRRKEVAGQSSSGGVISSRDDEEDDDDDILSLAKSFFDVREYRRAAHALRGVAGQKAVFLRCYATYLVCLSHTACAFLQYLLTMPSARMHVVVLSWLQLERVLLVQSL